MLVLLHHSKATFPQVLAEITQTWSVMSLSYETHSSTGTPLLKADENLIETLEDNQVSVITVISTLFQWFNAEPCYI